MISTNQKSFLIIIKDSLFVLNINFLLALIPSCRKIYINGAIEISVHYHKV